MEFLSPVEQCLLKCFSLVMHSNEDKNAGKKKNKQKNKSLPLDTTQ